MLWGVDACPRLFQRDVAQVGAEQLHGEFRARLPHKLQNADGDRVGLFTGGAARHPHAHRIVLGAVLQDRGQHVRRDGREGGRLAEKAGDMDQDVVEQQIELVAIGFQIFGVFLGRIQAMNGHATECPAADGSGLVMAEIHTLGRAEHSHDLFECTLMFRQLFHPPRAADIWVVAQPHQFRGYALRVKRRVDAACHNRAPRHAVIFRRFRVLRQRDAAGLLDGFQPEGAIGGCPREHYTDGFRTLIFRQRAEEIIDRHVRRRGVARLHVQSPMADGDAAVRRDDVDMIRLYFRAVGRHLNGHGSGPRQQLREHTGVLRVEVLDKDNRHTGVVRQLVQDVRHRFQASRRGADADDGAIPFFNVLRFGLFLGRKFRLLRRCGYDFRGMGVLRLFFIRHGSLRPLLVCSESRNGGNRSWGRPGLRNHGRARTAYRASGRLLTLLT